MQIGYGRATVRRWESGETVPSAEAEANIIRLCRERALFRRFTDGPLAGMDVSAEWLADLLAAARLGSADGSASAYDQKALPAGEIPPTQYAHSGDVAIAFQVFGSGPANLVMTPGFVSHRELEWEHPATANFFNRFGAIGRVAIFDKRGTGMSDRVSSGTLEERMDDIRAVMDAAGMYEAALIGVSEGVPLSILFAATYPQRTRALVLYGGMVCAWDPLGERVPLLEGEIDRVRRTWGTPDPSFLRENAPSVAGDPAEEKWWATHMRMSASPGAAIARMKMNADIDVRHVLPSIRVPTLILHRAGNSSAPSEQNRYLAAHIPGARNVELDGVDYLPMYGDVDSMINEIDAFLNEHQAVSDVDSVLATVLTLEPHIDPEMPMAAQAQVVRAFADLARNQVYRFRGRQISSDRSNLVAGFDGPSRAVRCALTIRDASRSFGVSVRAGLHTGEVLHQSDDMTGQALDVSLRIAELAAPGEVLVSSTVTDLVAGSDLFFIECEERARARAGLQWRVFLAGYASDGAGGGS